MKGIFLFFIRPLLYIWNPFPRRWKVGWRDGKPVLDIRTRRISKRITQAEITRRQEGREELKKCYKIGPLKGSAGFQSKLG